MKILIADDHPLAREGIRAMLKSEPELEVVGEAKNGEEAIKLCYLHHPDLVLMDIRMPTIDGLEATRAIKKERPQTIILMLTSLETTDCLLEALQAGAEGFVLKETTKDELLSAVRGALCGNVPLDESLAKQLLMRLANQTKEQKLSDPPPKTPESAEERSKPSPLEMLTENEREVLRLLVQGQTNKEIAKTLLISVPTVKKHMQQVFAKLGVSGRTQAAQ